MPCCAKSGEATAAGVAIGQTVDRSVAEHQGLQVSAWGIHADPRNLATTYTLDGLAQRSQLQSPDTGKTTYVYNAFGDLFCVKLPRGLRYIFGFNMMDPASTPTEPLWLLPP